MIEPTFHRIDTPFTAILRGYRTPVYAVRLGDVSIGRIEATTPSRYPGRSKAAYRAYPRKSQPWRMDTLGNERSLGTFASRGEAAEAIVAYLQRFAYGRKLLTAVEVVHLEAAIVEDA